MLLLDLADAFCQVKLPVALRKFFSLPAVGKRELGIMSVEGPPVDDTTPIFPQFRVMPMGGRMHSLFARPSFPGSHTSARLCHLRWRTTCRYPDLALPVLSVYVDMFATIGTNAAHVREVGNAVLNGATRFG